jgi:hypothetical protein
VKILVGGRVSFSSSAEGLSRKACTLSNAVTMSKYGRAHIVIRNTHFMFYDSSGSTKEENNSDAVDNCAPVCVSCWLA